MDELDTTLDELPHIPELAEYEVVRELGRGGTAVVFLARDRELSRDVAIKLIRPSYVKDVDAIARLEREAHTVGRLQHPNIAMLLGTRRLGDQGLALILQFVPGETLKETIEREGPLPFERVERILHDIGQALAYAHRQRIVHRDVKPQNVYLDEESGVARLADFGIARPWDSDSALTLPGTAIGTPTYMSPEQVDGDNVDRRSDIYSLGLVGYEMLTGEEPWAGESLYSIIQKQKYEVLPPLRKVRSGVPENLEAVIEKALQKSPSDRWNTAEEFLARLSKGSKLPAVEVGGRTDSGRSAGTDREEAAPSVPRPVPSEAGMSHPPPTRRRRRGVVLAMLVLALMFGGLAASLYLMEQDGDLADYAGAVVAYFRPLVQEGSEGATQEGSDAETLSEAADLDGPTPPGGDAMGPLPVFDGALPEGSRILPVGGTEQEGRADVTLSEPLTLQVLGPDGTPLPGVPVSFEVLSGEGSVGPSETVTDQDGIALALWTLGPAGVTEPQRVQAWVEDGIDDVVEFAAEIVPPLPGRLDLMGGGQQVGAVGGELPQEVVFRVWDEDGLPLPGVEVDIQVVSGGGSAVPSTAQSDDLGAVRVRWTLGPNEGTQQLAASVAGESGVQAAVTAMAERVLLPVRSGIVAGGTHSCRITGAGEILCWGDNDSGQLGIQGFSGRPIPGTPVASVTAGGFSTVAAGVSHTCALDREGALFCWGQNTSGQLGNGSFSGSASPVSVAGNQRFAMLSVGAGHSCGLRDDGVAFCWGENSSGQLGDGSRTRRSAPVQVRADMAFQSIAAGWNHTCGLDPVGRAHCWGGNASGEAGVEGASSVAIPSAVRGQNVFQDITAGGSHTCGLTSAGDVLCWGANSYGQLGSGTGPGGSAPVPVSRSEPFASVAAGGVHTCGLTRQGTALCWGRNHFGQLGDGTLQDRSEPVQVAGSLRFTSLEAMGSHTCGRIAAAEAFCWGYNIGGQLGDGTRKNRSTPVRVSDPGG